MLIFKDVQGGGKLLRGLQLGSGMSSLQQAGAAHRRRFGLFLWGIQSSGLKVPSGEKEQKQDLAGSPVLLSMPYPSPSRSPMDGWKLRG